MIDACEDDEIVESAIALFSGCIDTDIGGFLDRINYHFVLLVKPKCMIAVQEEVSTFARLVDKLRLMDEAELKLAYIRLFKNEIEADWKNLIEEMNFGNTTDDEIIEAFQRELHPAKA